MLRLRYLSQPMRYDESVTYLYFVAGSWANAISSYTYPNNHVFHTLLVKACVVLLGNSPWVLRLPAFLTGVAMIPMTFAVGRRAFGLPAAYIGAGIVAASGGLVLYSTNARGYTIVSLATLVLWWLLLRLRERQSSMLWVLTVLLTALGIWTIPVMLFPAGGLCLWFVLSALRDDTSSKAADLAAVLAATVATGVVASVLYAPIAASGGYAALTGNAFVRASRWPVFFAELTSSIKPTLAGWTIGFPVIVAIALGACAVIGLFGERTTTDPRVPIAGTMYVWCAIVLIMTHRAPFARVWIFWVAPIALYAAHGIVQLLSDLGVARERLLLRAGTVSVVLTSVLSVAVVLSGAVASSRDTGTFRDAERAAKDLLTRLRPGDRVIAPLPSNAPLAYYFIRLGVDTTYLSSTERDSASVYLIVNTDEGRTLRTELHNSLMRSVSRARLVARYPSAKIYRLY